MEKPFFTLEEQREKIRHRIGFIFENYYSSMEALGVDMGYRSSSSSVSQILNGIMTPSLSKLYHLAVKQKVSLRWLLGEGLDTNPDLHTSLYQDSEILIEKIKETILQSSTKKGLAKKIEGDSAFIYQFFAYKGKSVEISSLYKIAKALEKNVWELIP